MIERSLRSLMPSVPKLPGLVLIAALTCVCGGQSPSGPVAASMEPAAVDQAQSTSVSIRGQDFLVGMVSSLDTTVVETDSRFQVDLLAADGTSYAIDAVRDQDEMTLAALVPAGTPAGWYVVQVAGPLGVGRSSDTIFKVYSDLDSDGVHDDNDDCVDVDGDGLGRDGFETSGCANPIVDTDDENRFVCGDTDNDMCEDCTAGSFMPSADGLDEDGDGFCTASDCDDTSSQCGIDCQQGGCWVDLSCDFRIRLTLDNSSSNEELLEVALAIRLNDQRVTYGDLAPDGSDLRFLAADGSVLPHEVEAWNPLGESLVWISHPRLAALQSC